jgi:hypothetical protein
MPPSGEALRASGTARFALTVDTGRIVATQDAPDATIALEVPRPNPATREAVLDFSVGQSGHARLSVVDVQGREVLVVFDGAREPGPGSTVLNVSGLAAGVYMVRLDAGGHIATQRFVVSR